MTTHEVLHALVAGPVAWRCRAIQAALGRVVAVFEPVFYAEIGSGLVCIATRAVEPGPLTVVTSAASGVDWRRSGVTTDLPVAVRGSGLEVPGQIRIELAGCGRWFPPEPPSERRIAVGLARLAGALPDDSTDLGLAAFLRAGRNTESLPREIKAAAGPVAAARRWSAEALCIQKSLPPGDLNWSGKLIGLGPGLTPSGDDFLGGMLIALGAVGAKTAQRKLWERVRTLVRSRTNPISAAFLEAAAEGLGSASLHFVLNSILAGGAGLDPTLANLARVGHSSGWDALTGVVAVLEAAREVGDLRAA